MENEINLVKLLKDCPRGMELDCSMFENTYFDKIDDDENCLYRIICYVIDDGVKTTIRFTKFGGFNTMAGAKCVIFPKGKTTWEGFHRPFKDGDILATDLGSVFYLNTRLNTDDSYGCYVGIGSDGSFRVCERFAYKECCGFATGEEKEKLFKAIKDNGYKWNAETKTLEKLIEPKFKVWYKIKRIKTGNIYEIIKIVPNYYIAKYLGSDIMISFKDQDEYELVPTKFDINTLVPFESKVLVRDCNWHAWEGEIFTRCTNKSFNNCDYVTLGGCCWKQCIPYNDDTKYLLGTTNDCNDYYKNWK